MEKSLEPPYILPKDKLTNMAKAKKAILKAPKVEKLLAKRAKKR